MFVEVSGFDALSFLHPQKLTNMFNIKIYFDIFIKILIIDPIQRFGSVSL